MTDTRGRLGKIGNLYIRFTYSFWTRPKETYGVVVALTGKNFLSNRLELEASENFRWHT